MKSNPSKQRLTEKEQTTIELVLLEANAYGLRVDVVRLAKEFCQCSRTRVVDAYQIAFNYLVQKGNRGLD